MADNFTNVINPEGKLVSLPAAEAQEALKSGGYSEATHQDLFNYVNKEKFEQPEQIAATAAEGFLNPITLGTLPWIEKTAGITTPEAINARRAINPGTYTASEIGGLAASNFIPGVGEYEDAQAAAKAAQGILKEVQAVKAGAQEGTAAFKAAGIAEEAAAKQAAEAAQTAREAINPFSAQSVMSGSAERVASKLGLSGPGYLNQIAGGAAKGVIETAMFQAQDEVSKALSEDPHSSLESAVTNVTLAGLLGGAFGGGLGVISPLWAGKWSGKLGQEIENAKARGREYLNVPDPVGKMTEELTNHINSSNSVFDEVYGAQGLKAEAIQKLMPKQYSEDMASQAQSLLKKASKFSEEMQQNKDLYPAGLQAVYNKNLRILSENLSKPASSEGTFGALQDFKQRLQDLVKYDPRAPIPKTEQEFVNGVKSLAYDVRTGLEDSQVWGKAADVQSELNKAFKEYQTPLKQFRGKFMGKLGDEFQIDPTKIQTYINQTGKAGQQFRREMLGNFLEADAKYRAAVDSVHAKMGLESPFPPSSIQYTKSTLNELTSGAKVMDAFLQKGLNNLAGKAAGTTIGAGIGSLIGHPWIGAIVGEHALAPFFSSILPSLMKPILESAASPTGLKAATDYGMAVMKGQKLMKTAAANLFKSGSTVIPTTLIPDQKQTQKLDTILTKIQQNPEAATNIGGDIGHYLPQHATAIGALTSGILSQLQQAKPYTPKNNPLDSDVEPSQMQQAQYQNLLAIAQQPLIVLNKIKDGNIGSPDVVALKSFYPSLYNNISNELVQGIMTAKSNGQNIPYETRMGLSLFLGRPLDSTMTPTAIQLAQPKPNQAPPPSQQASHPSKTGAKALQKEIAMLATPDQAREMHRASRR